MGRQLYFNRLFKRSFTYGFRINSAVFVATKGTCLPKLLLFFFLIFLGSVQLVGQTVVDQYGQLGVKGVHIVDKKGAPVQLRGMSLFWSQWRGQFYNYESLKWLKEDWRCTIVRAAMAVERGGYAQNPKQEKEKVFAVIDAAIELGLYVIVDFHAHEAEKYTREAKKFFAEVAKKYGHHPNIIYELWNEPLDQSWSGVIKPYHETIIKTIRKHDPDNIIVCGTRQWSQRVDEAALDPIKRENIAYTLHFYAGTHQEELRDIAQKAIDQGVALFVTEYGTTNANGDGPVNEEETKRWWDFLDRHKISHCNWSVADLNESSAALQKGASATGGWPVEQITKSGQFVRNELRAKNPVPSASGEGVLQE